MSEDELLMSLLSLLREKHKKLDKISQATKGLECLPLDDDISLSSFLSIRQSAMNDIDKLDNEIKNVLSRLPPSLRKSTEKLVRASDDFVNLDGQLQTEIFNAGKSNKDILKKIIQSDVRFNKNVKKRINI